jgi:hypothetical protein
MCPADAPPVNTSKSPTQCATSGGNRIPDSSINVGTRCSSDTRPVMSVVQHVRCTRSQVRSGQVRPAAVSVLSHQWRQCCPTPLCGPVWSGMAGPQPWHPGAQPRQGCRAQRPWTKHHTGTWRHVCGPHLGAASTRTQAPHRHNWPRTGRVLSKLS